ncbi:hypothetical protein [Streptomyces sp. SD31]|uniref:hypothetical protein n=1 Tax=Streptomyces sp. SD31 TaxID=3452208 RepID=UPI003F8B76D0
MSMTIAAVVALAFLVLYLVRVMGRLARRVLGLARWIVVVLAVFLALDLSALTAAANSDGGADAHDALLAIGVCLIGQSLTNLFHAATLLAAAL